MCRLKLSYARLAIAGLSLATAACTASPPNSVSAAMTSPQCAANVGVPGEALEGAPVVLVSEPAGALRMDRFYILTGDCADEARSFEMEHILFADGRVMAIADNGALTLATQDPGAVEPSVLSASEAPRLDGAPLVHAERMSYRREGEQLASTYVGVWRPGARSIVATFRISGSGQASAPQPILESDLPITGVGYFPSPDSPSGQLGVVQQVDASTARLLNYQWHHPGL